MWDATSCIEEIISKAEKSIILIDGYKAFEISENTDTKQLEQILLRL